MTDPGYLSPGLRRLSLMLRDLWSAWGETRFHKYQVAPRPGAESLRRRLLLRLPGTPAERPLTLPSWNSRL